MVMMSSDPALSTKKKAMMYAVRNIDGEKKKTSLWGCETTLGAVLLRTAPRASSKDIPAQWFDSKVSSSEGNRSASRGTKKAVTALNSAPTNRTDSPKH